MAVEIRQHVSMLLLGVNSQLRHSGLLLPSNFIAVDP